MTWLYQTLLAACLHFVIGGCWAAETVSFEENQFPYWPPATFPTLSPSSQAACCTVDYTDFSCWLEERIVQLSNKATPVATNSVFVYGELIESIGGTWPGREGECTAKINFGSCSSDTRIEKWEKPYLEVNNRGRGLIKKFIISVGKFIIMGISKFKTNAT